MGRNNIDNLFQRVKREAGVSTANGLDHILDPSLIHLDQTGFVRRMVLMRTPSCLFVMLARGKFCGYQTRQELPRLWTPPTPSDGTLFYNNGYSLPDSARSRCYTVLRSCIWVFETRGHPSLELKVKDYQSCLVSHKPSVSTVTAYVLKKFRQLHEVRKDFNKQLNL
ncbi:hypothetical protein RRG08_062369 [Elysia crispata]|uniref:Uncharacterized protein n=1 Tax=Elysia crispata TaxID=231223 RepID=A0AAE0YI12_9GAST|nr:hypothetical protein RRG08_062369 [Elysia crispata]